MEYIKNFQQYKAVRSNLLGDLYFLFLALAVLIMPFDKTFPSLPVNLAAISALLNIVLNGRNTISKMKPFLVSASLYIIFLYAYFISENTQVAYYDTRAKASILFAPLLIGWAKELTRKHIHTLFVFFIFSCFCMTLASLTVASYNYYFQKQGDLFFYKKLITFVDMHPAYLGMYVSFCILYITIYLFKNYEYISSKRRGYLSILILWFLFYLLLLTSKVAIISSVVFVNVAFLYWSYRYKKLIRGIMIISVINFLGILVLLSLQTTKQRMEVLLDPQGTTYENSVESRQYIWKAIYTNLHDFWLKGVGNGDDTQTLTGFYEKADFKKGVQEKYNAHNQFLQVWVMCGIVGLIMYLFLYLYQLKLAWKLRDTLYFLFLIVFIINCTTESMLEVQSGIFFFAFFNAFFLKLHFSSTPEPLPNKTL